MIIAAAHHGVDGGGLLLAGVGVVGVVARDDEVVHLLLEHLLAGAVLDIAASGTCTVLTAYIVLLILHSVLNAKIRIAVELLTPGAVFVAGAVEHITLLWNDSHRIDHHRKILLKMGRAEHF